MIPRRVAMLALLAGAAAPSAAPIRIQHFLFQQPALHIAVGDTVTWTNADNVVHTVVADGATAPFRSPPLDEDDRFSFTFAHAGVYHYHCSLHPKMQGIVVVGAAS